MFWFFACVDAPPSDTEAAAGAPLSVGEVSATVDATYGSLVRVRWTQGAAAAGRVVYRVADGEPVASPVVTRGAGAAEAVLLGVPYDAEVAFTVVLEADGETAESAPTSIRTAALPEDIPSGTLLTDLPEAQDPSSPYFLLSLDQANQREASWALIVDRQGRVVWARESPAERVCLQARVSWDGGSLLVDEDSFWGAFDEGAASQVVRMTIDGGVLETIPTPGLHHPFTDLPDGGLLWGAYGNVDETLVRRDADGTTRTLWDCADVAGPLSADQYCGSNTIWWDEATDTVLFSMYSLDTVFQIDGDTGATKRWFGRLPGAWAFDPPESQFWFQHGANLTADGTLLLSTHDADIGKETLAREYALDTGAQTLREVWSYSGGIYGDVMGEAHRLGNGNTLENYGSATRIREVTPAGEVVWDYDWAADTLGRSQPLADLYALLPAALGGTRD